MTGEAGDMPRLPSTLQCLLWAEFRRDKLRYWQRYPKNDPGDPAAREHVINTEWREIMRRGRPLPKRSQ